MKSCVPLIFLAKRTPSRLNSLIRAAVVSAVFLASSSVVFGQNLDRIERGRAKDMLNAIKGEIKKNYYDPTYHNVDLDARFKAAEEKLEQATTIGQAHGIIAQAVLDLNDSHTIFIPPAKNIRVEYGWRMKMIGDNCYVVAVKPKSDAEAKGLKVGDQILSVNGFRPNRKEMWKVEYYYYALSPRTNMQLVVQSPAAEQPREVLVDSKITQLKRVIDLNSSFDVNDLIREAEGGEGEFHRFKFVGNIAIWQMPSFRIDPKDLDAIMRDRIKGKSALILDLRGNGGGLVVALEQLAGYFFDKDIRIADLKGRKEMKPMVGKTQGRDGFAGKLVILIDSDSASASEVLPRLIQLEKRGVVLGDRSSGKVMQSRNYSQRSGTEKVIFYSLGITNADVIMSDGKSIEHVGVMPDEVIVPTGADLAARRDPALARALEILGVQVSPEDAGKYFPFDWDKQ